jgi:protein TonB
VGRGLREPRRIRNTPPSYPESAKKAGIGGVVILEITIAPEGHVAEATVLRGVHPEIDQAAVDAVKNWLYEPSMVRGVAVPVLMTVTVNFRME